MQGSIGALLMVERVANRSWKFADKYTMSLNLMGVGSAQG